jgi:hypothetical protein
MEGGFGRWDAWWIGGMWLAPCVECEMEYLPWYLSAYPRSKRSAASVALDVCDRKRCDWSGDMGRNGVAMFDWAV